MDKKLKEKLNEWNEDKENKMEWLCSKKYKNPKDFHNTVNILLALDECSRSRKSTK